ncbi:hypothetical protein JCM3774_001961 [Rhodotorula dairenensis]
MTLSRSRLFLKRRPDAERLAGVIGEGHIGDVLDELDDPVWQPPDELPWDSCLPSPDVPVDATTSLGVTLLSEALLTPREHEFRLAVACLLLEKGAQPCTCTENGRAIEAVLEQLPPPQYEGDWLWQIRDVMTIAVDCRLNRIPFLISQHAPFVGEWIDWQLAWLQGLEQEQDDADSGQGATAGDAETVLQGEPATREDEELPDYVDEDSSVTDKHVSAQVHVELAGRENAGLSATLPAQSGSFANSAPSGSDTALLRFTSPSSVPPLLANRAVSPESRPSSVGAPTRPAQAGTPGAAGTPGSVTRASRLPASVRDRPRLSVRMEPQVASVLGPAPGASGSTRSQSVTLIAGPHAAAPASLCLSGLSERTTPTILKHHLVHGPATILTEQQAKGMRFLEHFLEIGSFKSASSATTDAAAPPAPVEVEVEVEEFKTQEERFFHRPVVGHVVYASVKDAEKARKIFDGQRMFSEAVSGSERSEQQPGRPAWQY